MRGVWESIMKSEIITEVRTGAAGSCDSATSAGIVWWGLWLTLLTDSHQSTRGCTGCAGGDGAADWSNYRRRPEGRTGAGAGGVVGTHPAGGRTGDVCSPVHLAGSPPSSFTISSLLYTITPSIASHKKNLVVCVVFLNCVSLSYLMCGVWSGLGWQDVLICHSPDNW